MTLEPMRLRAAAAARGDARRAGADRRLPAASARDDLQWHTDRPVAERLRFEAPRLHRASPGRAGAASARCSDDLALPPGSNPRTLAWARAVRAEPGSRAARRRARSPRRVLQHIRSGGYSYTLDARRLRPRRASTSSGSTASKASASTSPPPSSS